MLGPGALDGVRVVELSIAIAAPAAGRLLAFHGADVIRIESREHPDVIRLLGSAWARTDENRAVFMDSSPYLAEFDAGKRCVGLELKRAGGLEVAKRLVAQADVFLTNYSTPAVRGLGLGYEDVRAVNEDIIYVALPGFGSDEKLPYYPFVAWGPNQAPLVGMDAITGYPDQEPCGIATVAPPDYLASLHAALAILAGLEDRDVSGDGCYVDVSQFEASVAFLGPFVFENQLTGREQQRVGNRDARMAPSGVYPCRGVERYVAITVGDDAAWAALCRLAGKGWDDDTRFQRSRTGWRGTTSLTSCSPAGRPAAAPRSWPPGCRRSVSRRTRYWTLPACSPMRMCASVAGSKSGPAAASSVISSAVSRFTSPKRQPTSPRRRPRWESTRWKCCGRWRASRKQRSKRFSRRESPSLPPLPGG